MRRWRFNELASIVNLDRGHISVGFTRQTEERRQLIRDGRTESEHVNYATVASLSALEQGAPEQRNGFMTRLFGWMPREVVADAVREFTAQQHNTHCELCFYVKEHAKRNGLDVLGVALRAVGVVIEMRSYKRDSYTWRHVLCTPKQMLSMIRFACAEQGKEYDDRMMAKSATEPGPDVRDAYFCSQFVMACLEHLPHPVFHFNRANTMTIDAIMHILGSKGVVCAVPAEVPASVLDNVMGAASRYVVAPGTAPLPKSGKLLHHPSAHDE